MKKMLVLGLIMVFSLLSACSSEPKAITSKEDIQAHVQNFYDKMSGIEEEGKSSLQDFNTSLTSHSEGKVTDKQLLKAIEEFQSTATDLLKRVNDVKISSGLPKDIKAYLEDSKIAFKSAYLLKEQASKSADSADVTAEEFKELNDNADLAMMYGISKLNEARVASGLVDPDSTVEPK